MSGLGGFCPLPLRLGGGQKDGWTAAQHARVCADLVALEGVRAFARITLTIAAGVVTVVDYQGANGSGLKHAPTVMSPGTGRARLTWARTYEDDYGTVDVTSIESAKVTAHGSAMATATTEATSAEVVEVYRFGAAGLADGKVTVTVAGGVRGSRIGHYDGATDKTDATREDVPYAWTAYQEWTSALGDAFTAERTGLVHCRKLSVARNAAAVDRGAEKINTNSHPDTCDDMLGEWVDILKVRLRGDETRQEVRQLCAAKFESATGNDSASVDRLCERLLGTAFVNVSRPYGTTLDIPPGATFWPGINPSLPSYSLGGGTWFSERSQLVVNVLRQTGTLDELFDKWLNVDLFSELDRLLPAHATFAKAVLGTDGFHLDIDPMDGKGMT